MKRVNGELCTVLPACAGVIPDFPHLVGFCVSFTRMRGGDPPFDAWLRNMQVFYPHARG